MSFCSGNIHKHCTTPNPWAKTETRNAILPFHFARIAILSPMNQQPMVNMTQPPFLGWGRWSVWQLKHQEEGIRADPGQELCLLQSWGVGIISLGSGTDLWKHRQQLCSQCAWLLPELCELHYPVGRNSTAPRQRNHLVLFASTLPPASFISCSSIFDNSHFLSTT